jgi:hypothetical protein
VRSRAVLAAASLAVLALVVWALARGNSGSAASTAPPARPLVASPSSPPAAQPAAESRRDIFRFADEERALETASRAAEPPVDIVSEPNPTPEPGPRLVGLVRRGDRLVAALAAAAGDVELAGPGETAAGVVVVAIGDDSVRVRRPDGTEATLWLP